MLRFLAILVFAGLLPAQSPAPETATALATRDTLGRTTPQDSAFHFLEACHAGDYSRALYYLDLRRMTPGARAQDGPALARQLEDILDDTPFEITALSREPGGDDADGLSANFEHLAAYLVAGQLIDLQMERVEIRTGVPVWIVSADSVALIPTAHQVVHETPFEQRLPQQLVTFDVFATPVWRWIALLLAGVGLWVVAPFVAWAIIAALRPLADAPALGGPLRLVLVVAGLHGAMKFAPPATIARTWMERALDLIFFLALAWVGAVTIDLIAARWRTRLNPRSQAVSYSVLPLGRQVLKLSLFLAAILGVLSVWGYNTTTILAGLGVGGIAVALAAQKTIEDLFGGIAVIGDRPVLVGDVCRFGERTGTVMHIGLRSTRIRTPDRTIISVPNSQFSSMPLENISGRDKIWFHPTLNLRRDTTSGQLLQILDSFREVLAAHPQVETGKMPVRFIGVGPYSLDVEVVAYITTADYEDVIALQQELLIEMLRAVEHAGTALAVPIQENFVAPRPQDSNQPANRKATGDAQRL